MSFVRPAPAAVPFSFWTTVPANTGQTLLGPVSATDGIFIVSGIDVSMPAFHEGDNFQISITQATVAAVTAVLFQGSVYATSQANFQWRGELPLFSTEELLAHAFIDEADIVVWGARIPPLSTTI